jgi:phage gp36-like protein
VATSYATLADLTVYGLPATTLGQTTAAQQQAAIDAASATVDNFFNGRYALPLLSWDLETRARTCHIAAWNLLSVRGFNSAAGADDNIRTRYEDAMLWLDKVQRKAAHPLVTPSASQSPTYDMPIVLTSSVVTAAGRVGSSRGW